MNYEFVHKHEKLAGCGRECYQFRSKTCKCKQIIIYSDVIHKIFAILSLTYMSCFSCSGYKSSLLNKTFPL